MDRIIEALPNVTEAVQNGEMDPSVGLSGLAESLERPMTSAN